VEHRPQRHPPIISPTPRLARPPVRASRRKTEPISPAAERDRGGGGGGGGGGEAAGDTRRGEGGRGGGEPTTWTNASAICEP
jgi:hypothetical protein